MARVVSGRTASSNADRLRVCRVDTGKEVVQVVCGAPNARAGLTGIFAPPGTWIPGSGLALKVATIRGVESRGMLCSERELQLSEEHDGIIELGGDLAPGTSAAAALGLNDAVIDVSIKCAQSWRLHIRIRNSARSRRGRPRCAEDPAGFRRPGKIRISDSRFTRLSAGQRKCLSAFCRPRHSGAAQPAKPRMAAEAPEVSRHAADFSVGRCHELRFPWLGLAVVHAFDAAKLKGHMRARPAGEGETVLALDGKEYTLDPEMTVIADDEGARSIAGVMGRRHRLHRSAPREVFLESALFDPVRTARTGRMLGIVSDARYRFERGVDPEFVIPGLELATQLVLEICGGEASAVAVAGRVPEWRRTIMFNPSEVNRLGGFHLPDEQIAAILERLGFELRGSGRFEVIPPSWRADVHDKADLVEEVVRIHGLDKVPATAMSRPYAIARPVTNDAQRRASLARRAVAAHRGFAEAVHYSFIPRAHAALFGGGDESTPARKPDLRRSRFTASVADPFAAHRGGGAQPGTRADACPAVRTGRAIRIRHSRRSRREVS